LIALSLIAALSVTSHLVLDRTLVTHAGAASVINVSGRQRMLSQRIASLAAQLALGDDRARVDLTRATDELESAHARLIRGDPPQGLPAPTSPKLHAIYFDSSIALDAQLRDYIARARTIAKLPTGDPRLKTELPPLFAAARAPLLDGLNAITAEHQLQSEQQLRTLKTLQTASLWLILLTLAGEALGIFRPMVMRIMRYTAELKQAATTDPLTGAINRRSFTDRALAELARAARHGRTTAFLMVDADHFKAVNDIYGHGVGDEVLMALTSTLQLGLRPSDILGRIGGEEFAILLPETDIAGALLTAGRLRDAVASISVQTSKGAVGVTVSIGVTEISPGAVELKPAMDRADAALYQAKAAGRDRVVAISQPKQATDIALKVLGRVDGFCQDDATSESDERGVVLGGFLAT
jgi:diguanylate cyclase (GGDEF)-like protein